MNNPNKSPNQINSNPLVTEEAKTRQIIGDVNENRFASPELLATSVEKNGNGLLIPSSSSISLLSLSNEKHSVESSEAFGSIDDGKQHNDSGNVNLVISIPSSTGAATNISPQQHRNPHWNPLSQQRRPNYLNSHSSGNISRLSAQLKTNITSPVKKTPTKTLPGGDGLNLGNFNMLDVPDSPGLDPCTPSRNISHLSLAGLHIESPKHKWIHSGHSPVLVPVQTPGSEIIMTPLNLSHKVDTLLPEQSVSPINDGQLTTKMKNESSS